MLLMTECKQVAEYVETVKIGLCQNVEHEIK